MKQRATITCAILFSLMAFLYTLREVRHSDPPTSGEGAKRTRTQAPEIQLNGDPPGLLRKGRDRGLIPKDTGADQAAWLAARYLQALDPEDGKWAKDSYGKMIVVSAFEQAWGIHARLNLNAAQKDSLAEFLLTQKAWVKLESMDAARLNDWATSNLSPQQQKALREHLQEIKEGVDHYDRFRADLARRERGNRSQESIILEEMITSTILLGGDKAMLGADQVESRTGMKMSQQELDRMIEQRFAELLAAKKANGGKLDLETLTSSKRIGTREETERLMEYDTHFRFFNVIADRLPMSAEQQEAVFKAIQDGAKPPINPYDYTSNSLSEALDAARDDTRWMADLLSPQQYETYLEHFHAQIEMVRYQPAGN